MIPTLRLSPQSYLYFLSILLLPVKFSQNCCSETISEHASYQRIKKLRQISQGVCLWDMYRQETWTFLKKSISKLQSTVTPIKSKEESHPSINKVATAGRGNIALLTHTINTTVVIFDRVLWHLNKSAPSVSSLKKAFDGSRTQRFISHAYVDNHRNKPVKFKYSSQKIIYHALSFV